MAVRTAANIFLVQELLGRWPALFDVIQVKEDFRRLTAVDLESQFYCNLDKYTDKLLNFLCAMGGNGARKMHGILMLLDQDAGVDNRREVVIRGLMVHLSENYEHLITHYQDTHGELNPKDLKHHTLKIIMKGGSADGSPLEAGIVLEGVQVIAGQVFGLDLDSVEDLMSSFDGEPPVRV